MDYKTHRLAGLGGGLIVASLITPTPYTMTTLITYSIVGASSYLGSYLPDIDEPNSKIGKCFKPVSYVIKGIAGHRGIMHTPIAAEGLFLLLLFIKGKLIQFGYEEVLEYILLGIVTGFLSHLFIDSTTKGGIAWLYPFSKKKFSIAPLYSNNKAHQLLIRVITIIVTIGFLSLYRGSEIEMLITSLI